MRRSANFVLHGGDKAFANRQKLLFDELSNAEKECNKNKTSTCADASMDVDESCEYQPPLRIGIKRKHETKRFRGRESIFKRPEGPAPRASIRGGVPDHRRNPHKWVKYTLDDVPNDDMTDRSNTQAALSFLKELKARKLREQVEDAQDKMDLDTVESNEQGQTKIAFKSRKIKTNSEIEFKKPNTDTEKIEKGPVIVENDDKPVFKSSKVVMPEYVVGQKQKKKNKEKPKVKFDRRNELKLDHLQEFDEEET